MRPTYDAAERLEAATRELHQRLVAWYSSICPTWENTDHVVGKGHNKKAQPQF
jgi:hypothetical protein